MPHTGEHMAPSTPTIVMFTSSELHLVWDMQAVGAEEGGGQEEGGSVQQEGGGASQQDEKAKE
jgi:hypothetical protein